MVVSEQVNNTASSTSTLNTINSTNSITYSRELSDFLNKNLGLSSPKLDNSESTIDLSNFVLQGQFASTRQVMPISDILAGATTASSSKPNLVYLQNDSKSQDSSYDDESCDYEDVKAKTGKRKAATIGNVDRAKRLSTTSTTSSSFGENSSVSATTGRGRGGRRGARVASLLAADELSGEDTTARFGNKVVVKGTEEYNERRNKNNDAVKKCRAKLQEKQEEREKRLKELSEENRKLTNTVDSLNKELNVLKGILSTMKPQYSMPSDIEDKIKKLESMILLNNNNNNFNGQNTKV